MCNCKMQFNFCCAVTAFLWRAENCSQRAQPKGPMEQCEHTQRKQLAARDKTRVMAFERKGLAFVLS